MAKKKKPIKRDVPRDSFISLSMPCAVNTIHKDCVSFTGIIDGHKITVFFENLKG